MLKSFNSDLAEIDHLRLLYFTEYENLKSDISIDSFSSV